MSQRNQTQRKKKGGQSRRSSRSREIRSRSAGERIAEEPLPVRSSVAVAQRPAQGEERPAGTEAERPVRRSDGTRERSRSNAPRRRSTGTGRSSQRTGRRQAPPEESGNFLIAFLRRLRRRSRRFQRKLRVMRRENQARNFPESDTLLVQGCLLIWNILPMFGSLLRERILGRRKQRFWGLGDLFAGGGGRGRLYPILFMAGGCVVVAILVVCSTYTFGTTVTYDGEEIARLASTAQAEEARTDLERFTTRTLGETFTIDDSLIHYSTGLLKRQDLVDKDTFEEDLSRRIGLVTPAYCLYVEGERIGVTPYEGALEELLIKLQEDATTADTISCDFAEKVDIRQEYVPSSDIMNLGHIARTLYSTKTAEVTYEVKKGDTWSEIANSHDLTSKELLALNPGYNIDRISIGEVLTLSASVPYLTMTVVQQERYVEEVNYDIEYTDTADLYQGDYKVTSKGVFGAADMVASVTYVNGEETERTVLSSVTLREPVTEYRLRGTKERPTWHPTGTFRWPTSGRITSRFGRRSSPGGIGSTNHQGIDIAVPYGTPIYAADGGTVSYAGWMSGYGYLVEIDHGNGYKTRYGHNSRLTVSVGQHVYKGQQIARAGSTGNSTGNHCHFEVRVNGVARNPLNYLS